MDQDVHNIQDFLRAARLAKFGTTSAMARSKKSLFYAVAVGREGERIYETWDDCKKAVDGYSRSRYKGFPTEQDALDWLAAHRITSTVAATTAVTEAPPSEKAKSPVSGLQRSSSLQSADEFKPRLTMRYAPYNLEKTHTTPSGHTFTTSKTLYGHGVMPVNPPKVKPSPQSSGPLAPASSMQAMPSQSGDSILISSDVEEDGDVTPPFPEDRKPLQSRPVIPNPVPIASTSAGLPPQVDPAPEKPAEADFISLGEPAEPVLSAEQQSVLERVMRGESIFYTGSAGVGKSVLTRAIVRQLTKKYPSPDQVAVTATTGIAATNIGGVTLHSWAGCGLAKLPIDKLYWSLAKGGSKADARARWLNCKALIIDEVSMLHCTFFDKLEEIGRLLRRDNRPFGGIQLIVTGDFYQLPPVPDKPSGPNAKSDTSKNEPLFVFESKAWATAVPNMVVLKQVFRQKDDFFVKLLNEMRMGKTNPESTKVFQSLSRKVTYTDGIEPTCLYAKRNAVLAENNRRLGHLKTDKVTFTGTDTSGKEAEYPYKPFYPQDAALRDALDKNVLVEHAQELKIGAQVMLVKNLHTGGLVNGSIGKVVGFASGADIQEHRSGGQRYFEDPSLAEKAAADADVAMISGKPSGPTAPNLLPDPSVLDGVEVARAVLTDRERKRLGLDPGEEQEDDDIPPGTWPIVEFLSGKRQLLPPMDFSIENSSGQVEAMRHQIPLILAWALSIHKSQGQTLERVKVDLGDIFEAGQAFVALSRATQLETLQVLRFFPARVKAHPKVIAWYNRISQQGFA